MKFGTGLVEYLLLLVLGKCIYINIHVVCSSHHLKHVPVGRGTIGNVRYINICTSERVSLIKGSAKSGPNKTSISTERDDECWLLYVTLVLE